MVVFACAARCICSAGEHRPGGLRPPCYLPASGAEPHGDLVLEHHVHVISNGEDSADGELSFLLTTIVVVVIVITLDSDAIAS